MEAEKKIAAGWGWLISAMSFAAIGAVVPGCVDTHVRAMNDYLSVEAFVAIGIFSALAGVLCPRLFWVSALLIGLGLPATYFAIELVGLRVPRPIHPEFVDVFAIVPALLCSAAGAAWRLFFTRPLTKFRTHD